jgi:hypothetical protein
MDKDFLPVFFPENNNLSACLAIPRVHFERTQCRRRRVELLFVVCQNNCYIRMKTPALWSESAYDVADPSLYVNVLLAISRRSSGKLNSQIAQEKNFTLTF